MTTSAAPVRVLTRRVEHVMGMPISLAISGKHATSAAGVAAWEVAAAVLREADAIFSTYRADSWISRLRRGEVRLEDCPAVVREVFALAATARVESDGAFDIHLPQPDGTRALDPSGIVKGWAAERAAVPLSHLEDTDFCLSAGGDMVCSTKLPASPDWRIGIENPFDPSIVIGVVPLRNGAIATSGLVHRGAHIVDPRTGHVPSRWTSVTVIAPTLTEADVNATAAFVLGAEAPAWLAGRPGCAGIFVQPDGSVSTVGMASLTL